MFLVFFTEYKTAHTIIILITNDKKKKNANIS